MQKIYITRWKYFALSRSEKKKKVYFYYSFKNVFSCVFLFVAVVIEYLILNVGHDRFRATRAQDHWLPRRAHPLIQTIFMIEVMAGSDSSFTRARIDVDEANTATQIFVTHL
jgi:hypothetical protein